MIHFFRKTRKKLAEDNQFFKYTRYAIGEILLVVIGILIALQINNWNEERKSELRELSLLRELRTNLETNIQNLESDIVKQRNSIKYFDYILRLPVDRLPYSDSLPRSLSTASYAPDVVLTASAFETFKSEGLDLIKNDSLRREILNLFEVAYPTLMQETRRLEDQLWPAVVIPLYQKHFSSDMDQWIPNDYEQWLDDKEFFNMLSFRKTLRQFSTNIKLETVDKTSEVIRLIDEELEARGDH
ncbi:hypothetical protein SAMN06265375_101479 [Muriicola jejuensis]|uniref:Uncharacterized protein n=1 Tax=Muriicola jejuensis TaxID=504488 RepID=A0A6P0UFH3_9FLAO|nr:DUF6090 family protein [Muriicola jejuensis]NER09993.1 hypothetical protein [Muriicola jejuensis]SMP03952.1 hypothetical protein SAMN06265375_101479 [Muriicola jejuensis]